MSKINKILLILVVVLVVALGGIVYWQMSGLNEPYYAIYMNTGDLYFGKLSVFPRLSLSDVWYLQKNSQDAQNPISLSKLDRAFWGPEDKLSLNEKDVVWKAKLRDDSSVLAAIKNPQPLQQQAQPGSQQPTSTPKGK